MNYCELFRLFIDRRLPMYIWRLMLNLHAGHLTCLAWNGVVFDFFQVLNSVQQGEEISPVLFCI